ncbi:DUF4352 domain-containing protein [Streptomyces sp. NPDC055078]
MSQQYPGPQQPYQPHQGPAPYQPPRPPKKSMSTGAVVAIVIGSVVGGLLLLGILGAALSDDDAATAKGKKATPTAEAPAQPSKAPKAAEPEKKKAEPKKQAAPEAEVKVTAAKARFTPGILHDGGEYTSVKVTVTNNSTKKIDINPLYFTITDTSGTKHSAELAVDENQIDTMDLAPGENTTGIITGKGSFTPKYVTYVDGLIGDSVRGNVN